MDEIRRGWLVYLIVALLFAGMMTFYLHEDRFLRAHGEPVTAQIVSLSTANNRSRLTLTEVTVGVRTTDGLIGRATVPSGMVAGCKIGDRVPAYLVEGRLRVEPLPCPVVQVRIDE